MNLRCAICCLNAESPTESVMNRSACSLWHSTHIHACNLSFPPPARALPALPSLPLSLFFSRLPRHRRRSLVSWIFTPEVPWKEGETEGEKEMSVRGGGRGGEKPSGKEGKGKDKVEISRRHHSLPPRRLFVSPPSLWPYKTAFYPHSWRRHTVARPAENRVEIQKIAL